MVSYNSQSTKNNYKIQFETDSYEMYRFVEEAIRCCIDHRAPFDVYAYKNYDLERTMNDGAGEKF